MASGLGENASMAGRKETASEMKAQLLLDNGDDEERCAADLFGNCGVISVLFETPSGFTPYGFAIFDYDAVKLTEPDAWQHIWADFVNVQNAVIWVKAFKTFEYKGAINKNSVSSDLSSMIQKHVVNGQTLAVGNEDYKNVIQDRLRIPCVYSRVVKELMWGLMIQIKHFLPMINSQMINEDRFPMSEGMRFLLEYHNFGINPHMMVTKRIIEMAGILYECDRCVKKYDTFLRLAAQHLMKISRINTSQWNLMKLATAFKMICDPGDEISDARRLFSEQVLKRLARDAPRYQDKILKDPYSEVYKEMFSARKMRLEAGRVLVSLLKRAKKAYEDKRAGKAASYHETGPGRKKICRDFVPLMIDELTEWHTVLSAKRKQREVSVAPPAYVLNRYTQIFRHPCNTNISGILSMDIHPLTDIVAAGGIDTNVILYDFPGKQILGKLTGHSKKVTSLKFVKGNGLLITGSADETVRIWQQGRVEFYQCIHTLKHHTAEVEAVAVHPSQKFFVTTSRDKSWRFYDILTRSCLTHVGELSGQEGYTSAAFHPDGLLLGTGTLDGAVKIWDVKTPSTVTNIGGHVGPVNSISFSENGYHLATAGLDGVKIWDLRTNGDTRAFVCINQYSDSPINAVEFDSSGSYLAIGGSETRVFDTGRNWSIIKTLIPSETERVTCLKFGANAEYIAVGSVEHNLRIFGPPSEFSYYY